LDKISVIVKFYLCLQLPFNDSPTITQYFLKYGDYYIEFVIYYSDYNY